MTPAGFFRADEFRTEAPILEATLGAAGSLQLLVYGQPGANDTLEQALFIDDRISWTEVVGFTMAGCWRFLDLPNPPEESLFYRVRRNTDGARVTLLSENGPVLTLQLQGKIGADYAIEAKTQLAANIACVPVLGIALTTLHPGLRVD